MFAFVYSLGALPVRNRIVQISGITTAFGRGQKALLLGGCWLKQSSSDLECYSFFRGRLRSHLKENAAGVIPVFKVSVSKLSTSETYADPTIPAKLRNPLSVTAKATNLRRRNRRANVIVFSTY